jgi:hypothetical protein
MKRLILLFVAFALGACSYRCPSLSWLLLASWSHSWLVTPALHVFWAMPKPSLHLTFASRLRRPAPAGELKRSAARNRPWRTIHKQVHNVAWPCTSIPTTLASAANGAAQ